MSESDSFEMHEWLDGRLDPARSRAFERCLSEDASLRSEAGAYLLQIEQLRRHGERIAAEPVPALLSASVRGSGRQLMRPMLAAAAIAVIGWSLGWYGHMQFGARSPANVTAGASEGAGATVASVQTLPAEATPPQAIPPQAASPEALPPAFVRTALMAHSVFVPEVRHPVEVAASESAHLQRWLSNRLGQPVRIPDLLEDGYRLVGGRLLPCDSGACAQFMYEGNDGNRITLFAANRVGGEPGETAFRFSQQGAVAAFYWLDERLGYTLSGQVDRERLFQLAGSVYRQFER